MPIPTYILRGEPRGILDGNYEMFGSTSDDLGSSGGFNTQQSGWQAATEATMPGATRHHTREHWPRWALLVLAPGPGHKEAGASIGLRRRVLGWIHLGPAAQNRYTECPLWPYSIRKDETDIPYARVHSQEYKQHAWSGAKTHELGFLDDMRRKTIRFGRCPGGSLLLENVPGTSTKS